MQCELGVEHSDIYTNCLLSIQNASQRSRIAFVIVKLLFLKCRNLVFNVTLCRRPMLHSQEGLNTSKSSGSSPMILPVNITKLWRTNLFTSAPMQGQELWFYRKMEACQNVERDVDKVLNKFSSARQHINKNIDELLENMETMKEDLLSSGKPIVVWLTDLTLVSSF